MHARERYGCRTAESTARLVARGYSQQYGIDCLRDVCTVVRIESLRILLAIAAREDLEVHPMDVITAYLGGELEEEVYMEPPAGLPNIKGKSCKLRERTVQTKTVSKSMEPTDQKEA
jgi:hypothetical protein